MDDVKVTHYRFLLDWSELRSLLDFGLEPADAPEVVSYEVWIDADDLTRKMTYDVAGNSGTRTYSAYGEPVDVDAPPAAQLTTENPFDAPAAAS